MLVCIWFVSKNYATLWTEISRARNRSYPAGSINNSWKAEEKRDQHYSVCPEDKFGFDYLKRVSTTEDSRKCP